MKKTVRFLAAFLAVFLLVLSGCGGGNREIRFGTGGMGGNYYAYGNALAQIIEENMEGVEVDVKTTAGSAANLRLLGQDYLQMAIVQSDTLLDASRGEGVFEEKKYDGFSAVAGLYMEACQIIVPADSEIGSVEDLIGKRISVGEEDSGVMRNAEQILLANGITFSMAEIKYLSFADSAEAMKNNEIDAFFCTAGAPTTAVSELAKELDIRLLSLDSRTTGQMMRLYGCYEECVIPAGTYNGQTEDTVTLGVKAVLVASDKMKNETVERITELLFEHAKELKYATNADYTDDMVFATEAIPIPFHPGAAAYYEEQGIHVGTDKSGELNSNTESR